MIQKWAIDGRIPWALLSVLALAACTPAGCTEDEGPSSAESQAAAQASAQPPAEKGPAGGGAAPSNDTSEAVRFAPSPPDEPCRKTERSLGPDGSRRQVPRVTVYAYDEEGRLVQEDWGRPTGSPALAGVDSTEERGIRLEVRTRHFYDDEGRKVREERDRGMTGSPTQVVWFRHDEEGRLVGEERDDGNDGSVDWRRRIQRDAEGRMVVESLDADGDDEPDEVKRIRYPSPKRKVIEVDDDADGEVDKTITETRVSETVSKKRFTGKGPPTVARKERTLDDAGRVLKEESTMRMRGHANRTIVTFEYDDRGRKVEKRHDGDGDGTPESIVEWDYECEWEPEP